MMENSNKKVSEINDPIEEAKSEFSGESSSLDNSAIVSGRDTSPEQKQKTGSTKLVSIEDINREKMLKVSQIKPHSRRQFQRVKSEIDCFNTEENNLTYETKRRPTKKDSNKVVGMFSASSKFKNAVRLVTQKSIRRKSIESINIIQNNLILK